MWKQVPLLVNGFLHARLQCSLEVLTPGCHNHTVGRDDHTPSDLVAGRPVLVTCAAEGREGWGLREQHKLHVTVVPGGQQLVAALGQEVLSDFRWGMQTRLRIK